MLMTGGEWHPSWPTEKFCMSSVFMPVVRRAMELRIGSWNHHYMEKAKVTPAPSYDRGAKLYDLSRIKIKSTAELVQMYNESHPRSKGVLMPEDVRLGNDMEDPLEENRGLCSLRMQCFDRHFGHTVEEVWREVNKQNIDSILQGYRLFSNLTHHIVDLPEYESYEAYEEAAETPLGRRCRSLIIAEAEAMD
mmetsp:Transcript_16902/g.27947  ORF Transcript_16902/g.27947 Transcript_16902/m.27947 type:complete len:192 (+) Transcript_16902:2-577(+)